MSAYEFYITDEEYKLAENNGVDYKTFNNRVRNLGWNKKRAMTTPHKKRVLLDKKLVKKAEDNGIGRETLRYRLNNGWSNDDAATIKPVDIKEHMKQLGINSRKYPKNLINIAKKNGISIRTFYRRIEKDNMDPLLAAKTPLVSHYERGLLGKEAFFKANMY